MIRNVRYAVLFLLAAVLFTFGSMTVMNAILRSREKQLLTEKGRMEAELPVREWEGLKSSDKDITGEDTVPEGNPLTMEEIEAVIENWNNRCGVTLHDKAAGQISMEEAIENGKFWLAEMELCKDLGGLPLSVSAELGVGTQKEETKERREAYFSFWTVTYANGSIHAVLYLNAVTGKVWGAEITLYGEQQEKWQDDSLLRFRELSGIAAPEGVSPVKDSGETKTEIAIKGSRLYAQRQAYSMKIGFENCYERILYQLLIK